MTRSHRHLYIAGLLLLLSLPAGAQVSRFIGPDIGGLPVPSGDVTTFWQEEPFDAGDCTGSASMTWTCEEADVDDNRYMVIGTTLFWNVNINTTTVGGTPSTTLQLLLPGGYTAAADMDAISGTRVTDNNVGVAGFCAIAAGTTALLILRADVANWTASTNLTNVGCSIFVEVVAP